LTQFTDFGLNPALTKALGEKGYTQPTPIQIQAIPGVMTGRDLLGIAQTGTGKTAAFALPILHRLAADRRAAPKRGCRCLVLSPTRELATQIADSFRTYGDHLGFSVVTIFGGVSHGPQRSALARGVDIIVAAPGRLLDHLAERDADLSKLEIFVLDEADQMLDMGFIVPIRKIVKHLPKQRQNLFFSATMPADIGKLASELLIDPLKVSVAPQATTAERVNQKVVFVDHKVKRGLLVELFANEDFRRVLVFTRTKRGADRVARILEGAGVTAAAIHGNKSQNQRERALAEFKDGATRALVATDIAARGIDISSVSHVVQFELPDVPEQYVHRIGRTARAGKEGSAVAFCADDERDLLRQVEKVTRQKIHSEDRRNDTELQKLAASSSEPKAEAYVDPRSRRGQPARRGGEQQRNRGGEQRRDGRSSGQRSGGGQSSGSQSSRGGDTSSRPMAATEPFKPKPRAEQPAGARDANREERPRTERSRNERQVEARTDGGQRNGNRQRDAKPNGGRSDERRNGGQQASNGKPAAKPHRKGERTGTPNAPRNDVMRGGGGNAAGMSSSAADLMKHLSQGR
jgi:ATP-dependent RNA helicase RhlE